MESKEKKAPDQHLFLEELYVSRCKDTQEEPTHEEFMHFCARLKSKVVGKSIILNGTHLGSSAANTIAKFCRNRNDLFKIDLYCNTLRDQGLATIAHFIKLNEGIKIINVGCNDLTDKSQGHLANVILSNHVYSLQVGTVEKPYHPNSISPATLAVPTEKTISRSGSSLKKDGQSKASSNNYTSIDLEQKSVHPNNITSSTLLALTNAIIDSPYFQALGVSQCNFKNKTLYNGPPVETVISKLLSQSKSLRFFSAGSCNIEQKSCLDIINDGLMFNSTLRRIDLSGNWFGTQFGEKFAEYLLSYTRRLVGPPNSKKKNSQQESEETSEPSHLFYVDLSSNFFTPEVAPRFADVIKRTKYLGYLDLSDNNIGDEGAVMIAKALQKNQTIVEIHLSNCNITSQGGIVLAETLSQNEVLTTLNLSRNKLGDVTAEVIAKNLLSNDVLTTLNLSTSMITNKGGKAIAIASKECNSLTSIDMANNFFSEEVGVEFEHIFKQNKHVLKINVSGTQINHFSFHALNLICKRNAGFLVKKRKRPARNAYVQMKYLKSEIERKEKVLDDLKRSNNKMKNFIDSNHDKMTKLDEDKDTQIEQQILEKKQEFAELTVQYDALLEREIAVDKRIESNKKEIDELNKNIASKEATLTKLNNNMRNMDIEIKSLTEAAKQLEYLVANPDELAKLDALPEFIKFPDLSPTKRKRVVKKKEVRVESPAKSSKPAPAVKEAKPLEAEPDKNKKKEKSIKRKSSLTKKKTSKLLKQKGTK